MRAILRYAVAGLFAGTSVLAASDGGPQGPSFVPDKALSELRARIAGHEKDPAEQVFRDIQLFKGMPAARLLAVMEIGFARSLGVDCTHCHVAGGWEKNDKQQKGIAREMWGMTRTINEQLLAKIANLKSEKPTVNCATCHRGEIKPALNQPARTER